MIAYHEVPADRFAALASGLGGPEAVAELAAAQSSKRRLLLRYLVQAEPTADARAAVEVLIRADRQDRSVVTDLMGDPLVGAWTTRTARALGPGGSGVPPLQDLTQLGALAAAAAIRTRQDARLTTYAVDGRVTLPTLGTALVGGDSAVVVEVLRGSVTVSGVGEPVRVATKDPRWLPLRRLSARHDDAVTTIAIEDGNPYRDCYHAPPADRLGRDEVERWQALLDGAWSLLVRHLPRRAAELSVGLRSMVPLAFQAGDMARSGTARDSFGAMGLTTPQSATDFAITLVHEFQHSKLSGLLDIVPLVLPAGSERHFAPWREDARPTAGLLQGTYAFLGIADTWNGLRALPELTEQATRELAGVRCQVDAGLRSLERSTELTGKGREFVTRLRAATDRLLAEELPAAAENEAAAALAECRRAWGERNRVSAPHHGTGTIGSHPTAGGR